MSQIATVFKLNRKGFNPSRSVSVLIMLVPLVVLGLLDQEKDYLSVAFAALVVGSAIPAGTTPTGCRAWPRSPWSARC